MGKRSFWISFLTIFSMLLNHTFFFHIKQTILFLFILNIFFSVTVLDIITKLFQFQLHPFSRRDQNAYANSVDCLLFGSRFFTDIPFCNNVLVQTQRWKSPLQNTGMKWLRILNSRKWHQSVCSLATSMSCS